jgi:hypothetical protein
MGRKADATRRSALTLLLLVLGASPVAAARPEFYVGCWRGWNPDEDNYLVYCPGGSRDDDSPAKSWGGDLVSRFGGPTGVWVSAGRRDEPRPCTDGTDPATWVTAGGLLAGRPASRLLVELRGGAGSVWTQDRPGVWVIEGQLAVVGRVYGRLALTLAGGAQRRDNEPLDYSDFFGRAGIRLGPL